MPSSRLRTPETRSRPRLPVPASSAHRPVHGRCSRHGRAARRALVPHSMIHSPNVRFNSRPSGSRNQAGHPSGARSDSAGAGHVRERGRRPARNAPSRTLPAARQRLRSFLLAGSRPSRPMPQSGGQAEPVRQRDVCGLRPGADAGGADAHVSVAHVSVAHVSVAHVSVSGWRLHLEDDASISRRNGDWTLTCRAKKVLNPQVRDSKRLNQAMDSRASGNPFRSANPET